MFSSTTTRSDNQEEKKPLLSQSNSSAGMTSQSNPVTSQSEAVTSQVSSSQISIRKPRPAGPKMSDGTEFDTGPWGWIFSILYLFVLWGLSIAFAVAMVYFQYSRLDPVYPTYFGDAGFLGHIPRVTFDPNPHYFEFPKIDNIMRFNMYASSTYMSALIRLKKLLKTYDDKNGGNSKQLCNTKKLTTKEACKFDRMAGFDDCQLTEKNLEHGFGYSKGTPCFMLKLNKLVGWEPKFLTKNQTCPDNNLCCGEGIKFKCTSNDDVSFTFYPETGIPACYFPYANQPGYEQPYMMVKLGNITANKHVTVECWTTNPELQTYSGDKDNSVKFALKMAKDVTDEF